MAGIGINGTLVSNIVSGILAYTDSIYDKNLSKFQSAINEDLRNIEEVYATYNKAGDGKLSNIALYSDSAHTNRVTPSRNRLYVDITEGSTYSFTWNGREYNTLGSPMAIGEVAGSAFDGLAGKIVRDSLNAEIAARKAIQGMEDTFVLPEVTIPADFNSEWTPSDITSIKSWLQYLTNTLFAAKSVDKQSAPTSGDGVDDTQFTSNTYAAKLYVTSLTAKGPDGAVNGAYLYMGNRWDILPHYNVERVTIY